jgi:hypothetical protein
MTISTSPNAKERLIAKQARAKQTFPNVSAQAVWFGMAASTGFQHIAACELGISDDSECSSYPIPDFPLVWCAYCDWIMAHHKMMVRVKKNRLEQKDFDRERRAVAALLQALESVGNDLLGMANVEGTFVEGWLKRREAAFQVKRN